MTIRSYSSASTTQFSLFVALAIASASLMEAGCATSTPPTAGEYLTVERDPRKDPDAAQRLNSEALAYLQRREFDRAEELLKKALANDVTCGPAHNNLGKVYYHQSKLYLAAWEFQYAIQLMPHQPEPRNNLGLVFEAVGKLDDAVRMYDEALSLQPDDPQLVGNLARARVRRGDHDERTRQLLTDLIMKDSRPAWVAWAREKLAAISIPENRPDTEATATHAPW